MYNKKNKSNTYINIEEQRKLKEAEAAKFAAELASLKEELEANKLEQIANAKNNIFIRTDKDIRDAVNEWCANPDNAKSKYGDISQWDTSAVTSMKEVFKDKKEFNEDISQWNVSNVTDMTSMFQGASSFNQDISQWNVSNVTDMSYMFAGAESFNQDISKWNVSNVIRMNYLFYKASLFNQDIGRWPIKSDCDLSYMFYDCLIEKQTFEGKLYGNKIAKYFNLDNGNEFMVWEPFTRWQRRKHAITFFSSISKMNVDEVDDNKILTSIREIDDYVYKIIVKFI